MIKMFETQMRWRVDIYIEIYFLKKKQIENGPNSKYLFVNQSEDRPS